LFSFRWISRERTCADLVAFLSNDPPRRSRRRRDRVTAAQLLRTLALPEIAPALRRIALDPREEGWIRWCAIVALAKSGATFSAAEVTNGLFLEVDAPRDLGERLVTLVRDDASLAAAREAIALVSPERRAEILGRHCSRADLEPTPHFHVIRDEVYASWLDRDRHALAPDRAREVTIATLERPESRRLLQEVLRTCDDEARREIAGRLPRTDFLALVRDDPALRREAVDRLALPLADLVELIGEDALIQGLERRIRELSPVLSATRHGHEPEGEAHRCLNVLGAWARSAGSRACSLLERLVEAGLDPFFWPKLERAFVSCDRARAVRWLERSLGETTLGETILERVAREPRTEDRPLLERALGAGPALRYLAIDGLEGLGGAERALLERIANDDPDEIVRLRAVGALALRGDAKSERILVGRATGGRRGVEGRAEAVRWLAELDPRRYFDVLEEALLQGLDYVEDYYQPIAEAAAFGVARLGGVEALSALFHAAFLVGNSVSGIVEGYLHDLLDGRTPRRETRWHRR
jgi:hypothetical protein